MPASPDAILICGSWPHPRYPIFTVAHDLMAALHRRGHDVAVICDGFPLTDALGPDVVCYLEFLADRPFDWRSAFARKFIARGLTALLAADRRRPQSLLARVGVVHAFLDQLVFRSVHPANSRYYDRTLTDDLAERTGQRPRLVRTRQDDLPSNLDGLMRLTGVDFVALDRPGRERILNGEVDIAPLVAEHTLRHRDRLRAWGWDDAYIDNGIHHALWLLHQLQRWREELQEFDAVVCLTPRDAELNRELLADGPAPNLTHVFNGTSFGPTNRITVDRMLCNYHNRAGLKCYRAGAAHREAVPFAPEDRKVVFVGRPARSKGIFELAEALRALYHSGRRFVRGIFVGPFGVELRRALSALDPAAAPEYLLFTGPMYDPDELAAVLAFGDVTAAPSHFDAFCLVVAESYRLGTPCVVTEGTGAGDAFLDHPRQYGLEIARPVRHRHADGLARYFGVDVASLTDQLADLLDRPAVAGQLARAGERFVREQYSAERMGETYAALYDLLRAGESPCRLYD